MKKLLIVLAIIIVIGLAGFIIYSKYKRPIFLQEKRATYFSYTNEEIAPLLRSNSTKEISTDEIYKWDRLAFDLVSKGTLVSGFDPNTSKLYAYLAVAQRDVAALSFNTKGRFAGSLAPISKEVLCIFVPEECSRINIEEDRDEYSDKLSEIVSAKVRARIAEDNLRLKPYPKKIGREYWDGPEPQIGLADGSSKTWLIRSGDQFRVLPPPAFGSEEFRAELLKTKKALKDLTEEQKRAVVFWAGGPGTMTTPGIWLKLADDFMRENAVSVEKVLRVRQALTMALADGTIAVFDSKYTYWTRRPFMMDSSVVTIMPTPNHPSYPAGHSVLSAASATILAHYFPEKSEEWKARAEEGGISRVWGGIHYPMDNLQGNQLGEKVGKEGLNQLAILKLE
jgi:hypothetical protein